MRVQLVAMCAFQDQIFEMEAELLTCRQSGTRIAGRANVLAYVAL